MLKRWLSIVVVAALVASARADLPAVEKGSRRTRSMLSFERPEYHPPTSPLSYGGLGNAQLTPILLSEQASAAIRPINIGGWTELSYTASTDRSTNGPMGFNNRANQFLLQQNWLQIDREAVDDNAVSPTFGFRLDAILPGSDYRFTLPRGLFNGHAHGMIGRYDRLRGAGMLMQAEIAERLGIHASTVRKWRNRGLLAAHAYNDKHECLYEPPGANRPIKHHGIKLTDPRRFPSIAPERTNEVQHEA